MLPFALALALALTLAAAAPAAPPVVRVPAALAIATEEGALLETQAAAWNRGDLEAFCSVYADDALFATASGPRSGSQWSRS